MIPLVTLYSEVDGSRDTSTLPDDAELTLGDLGDHPFLWALDAFVFAGPNADIAWRVYSEDGEILTLDVDTYKILDTVDGVMTLHKEAVR